MNIHDEINRSILATPVINSEERAIRDLSSAMASVPAPVQSNPAQDKIARLEAKKAKLFGMQDGDTFNLTGGEKVRSAIGDSVELPHGEHPYDMYGGAEKGQKSPLAMKSQRELTAKVMNQEFGLGLTSDTVTEQDMIDVANREQIQALSDLSGGKNWVAPLIRNVTPTNLTGHYTDENNRPITAPLDINIGINKAGTDRYGRTLGLLSSAEGDNATLKAAMDPNRNAASKWLNKNMQQLGVTAEQPTESKKPSTWDMLNSDKDGMFGESVDITQSSLVQQYGKTNKALRNMGRWGAEKLGLDKDTIDAWLPTVDKVGTIGFGDTSSMELAKREVADKITGVMVKTREEQDAKMNAALKSVEKGNYGEAALDTFTILPYILGDSAGEIASIMTGYPGVALAVSARVNEDAEDYKKNNPDKEITSEWLMGSTLSNAAVLLGERLIIGKAMGNIVKDVGRPLITKGKHAVYSALGETVQEYADQTQQMYWTQKEGERTLTEIGTSPEAKLAALTGGVMGSALSGAGFGVSASVEGVKKLDEKIASVTDRPVDPTAAYRPESFDERMKVWDAVDATDFVANSTPEARSAQTETVANFAASLLNADNMIKYNKDRSDAGVPKDARVVLEQASRKIAKINGLDEQAQKDAIMYFTATKMVNYADGKGAATGLENVSKEEAKNIKAAVAKWIEGSKPAEQGFIESQKAALRGLFDSSVDLRKAKAIEGKLGLENIPDGDFVAKLMTMSDEQYAELMSAVRDMKVLGSSNSRIVETATAVENSVEKLREFATKLGSGKFDGPGMDSSKVMQKTYSEVANEVENVGFLGDSKRMSIKGHGDKLNSLVNQSGLEENYNEAVDSLGIFVANRGVDKIHGMRKKTKEATAAALNNVVGIENILNSKIAENDKILQILQKQIAELESNPTSEAAIKVNEMFESMLQNQVKHKELLDIVQSSDAEVRKSVYTRLNDSSQFDVIDSGDGKSRLAELIDAGGWDRQYVDTTSADMGDLDPETGVEVKPVKELADKIVEGKELTAEDLQTQENYSKELEKELKERQKSEPVKEQASAPESKSEYAEAKEGEIEPETREEYAKKVGKDLETAIKYAAKLDKDIAETTAELKASKTSYKALRDVQRDAIKKIKPLQDRLTAQKAKLDAAKRHLEAKKDPSLVERVTKEVLKHLRAVVSGLQGWVTRYTSQLVKLETDKEVRSEELVKLTETVKGLMAKKKSLAKAKKIVKAEIAKHPRKEIEAILGGLVAENKSSKLSLNSTLAIGDIRGLSVKEKAESVMGMMPNIIKNSPTGKESVESALETLQEFGKYKTSAEGVVGADAFPKQTEGSNNPLTSIEINGVNYSFADLWVPVINEYTKDPVELAKNKERAETAKKARERLKSAMNIVGVVTLKEMMDVRAMPADRLKDLVEGSFSALIDSEKDSAKRGFIVRSLMQKMRDGEIVPESTFKRSAGQMLIEQLELKFNENITKGQLDNLTDALGALTINNLLPWGEKGLKKEKNPISRKSLQKNADGHIEVLNPTAVNLDEDAAIRLISLEEVSVPYQREIRNAAKVFEYASEKSLEMVSDSAVKASDKVKNSYFKNAKETKDYLDKQGEIEWKFDDSFIAHIEKLEKAAKVANSLVEEGESAPTLLDMLTDAIIGTEQSVLENSGPLDFESNIAKYSSEKLTIERMLETYRDVGKEGFYIGWAATTSMRSMMTSNMLNMQASGISRFVVKTKDLENTINPKEITQKELNHIELAIAQALDIGIDKKLAEDALGDLHKDYVKIVKTKKGLKLEFGKNPMLNKLVEDKNFLLSAVRELKSEFENDGLEVHSKSIMHLVQAVELLREIHNNGTAAAEIRTNLALEADGITNGMMFLMMQLGLNEITEGFMEKGGIYREGGKYKNHGEFKSAGNNDIYQTPIKGIEKVLDKTKFKLLDSVIKGQFRNFLKEGVMTFIYGSGMSTIRENAAMSLILGNGYLKGGLGQGKINELIELAGLDSSFKEKVTYRRWIKVDDKYQMEEIPNNELEALQDKNKYAYLDNAAVMELAKGLNDAVGPAIETSFLSSFGAVIDYRRAIKTIEEVNYVLFEGILKDKIATQLKKRGVEKENPIVSDLTRKELEAIQQEMLAEGTYYGAEGAIEGSHVDYFKTDKESNQNMIEVTINTNNYQSGDGSGQRNYASQLVDTIANIGAVGVTTVHNGDGSVMVRGHRQAVLNIYDALMLGSNLEKNTAQIQELNKAFYAINMEHSMLGSAIEKMLRMYTPENIAKVSEDSKAKIIDDMKRIFENRKLTLDSEIVNSVVKTIEKAHEDREKFIGTPMVINQYMAATDIEGVLSITEKVAPTIPGNIEESVAKIREALEWLMESATVDSKKERAKENVGIIQESELDNVLNSYTRDETIVVYKEIRKLLGKEYAKVGNTSNLLTEFKKKLKESC